MDLKLDFKIALKYSLLFSIYLLILKISKHFALDENYFLKEDRTLFSCIGFLYSFIFAFLLCRAFLEYIQNKKHYLDLIFISFAILFLVDFFQYLIDFGFFKMLYESESSSSAVGLSGLLDGPLSLSQPQFNFISNSIIQPFIWLYYLITTGNLNYIWAVLLNKLFILLFFLYQFNLFFLFKKYGRNKWFSVIPILNKLTLLKIAEKPVLWIILVFIPFVRYFFLYSVNKKIAEENGFDSKLALGMTFLPSVFYGKVSFAENVIPVTDVA